MTVVQSRPRRVSVLGAVRAPGQYDCRIGTHLLDTLAACGGPAQAPELTQATLVTGGGTKTQPIDVVKLMDGSDPDLNVLLQPGDVLLVQPRDPAVADVQVMGEVGHPGIFTVPVGGASVSSMLTEAGGTTPRAALSRVQIMHGGEIKVVDLRPSQSSLADPAGEQHLVAGDVLLVPDTGAKVGLLGEFRAPGAYDYPDRNGLTASDRAVAGGRPDEPGRPVEGDHPADRPRRQAGPGGRQPGRRAEGQRHRRRHPAPGRRPAVRPDPPPGPGLQPAERPVVRALPRLPASLTRFATTVR